MWERGWWKWRGFWVGLSLDEFLAFASSLRCVWDFGVYIEKF
jgi:hypothetical protein